MFFSTENYVSSQRLAQKLLSSSKMLPPSIKPYLQFLQRQTDNDFSALIDVSDKIITFMQGGTHQKIKKALAKPLGIENLQTYTDSVSNIGNSVVESLIDTGRKIDLRTNIENPLFVGLVKEVFGFQPENEGEFIDDIDVGARIVEPMQSVQTMLKIQDVYVQLIENIAQQLESTSSTGLLGDIHQQLQAELATMPITSVASVIAILIVASRTITETLTHILIENSKQLLPVRQKFSDTQWVKDNIDAVVRFCASTEFLTRVAGDNMSVDDKLITKGESVWIHIPSVNRDPGYYANCEYARISEFPDKRHLSFGAGVHRCPGQHLGLMALSVFLPQLYSTFPKLSIDLKTISYKQMKQAKRVDSAQVCLY